MTWIDTHCHLDAPEFSGEYEGNRPQVSAVRSFAATKGVALCVIPAVAPGNFEAVRQLAHAGADAYALGIHPLMVPRTPDADLQTLDHALTTHAPDGRLVAVGEIGLDFFVPALCEPAMRERQEHVYRAQLELAHRHRLPVIVHVRRSADRLLKHLRELASHGQAVTGIAHAFNGSRQQAEAFVELGFKLGFGGAVTFERALQLRRLAAELPLAALVMETDAPDIPPHWLYRTAEQRAAGEPQGRNEPGELPRIAAVVAELRGIGVDELAAATTRNALAALPRLAPLLAANKGAA